MSDGFKRRTMPYLPRYKPLSSANRRPRYPYPGTTSSSRELIYYIDGRPARVINSYQTHSVSSSNKSCRIFLSCPNLDHYLTRVTGNTSCYDSSSSHVYTNPGNPKQGSPRQRGDDGVADCQDICHSSSGCLDMTLSESGVSVGESEDWSVCGHESDNTSQRSSNSWSTFCEGSGDNDTDRIEMDNFNSPGFLGDMPRDSHYSCHDYKNFVNDIHNDHMPNHESHNRENNRYSHNGGGRETPTNVSTSWHVDKAENKFSNLPGSMSTLESHPGILDESIKYIEQTEPTSANAIISTGRGDKWHSESRDSVVCDTSSSDWCDFAPFGKLDNCRYLLQLDVPKREAKCEDLNCGNGLSVDDSCVLDSKVSPLSCDVWMAGTSGNVEFSRTHDDMRLTNIQSDNETRADGDTKVTKTHCDMELTQTWSGLEETRISGDPEMTVCCGRANSLVISSDENTDRRRNGPYPFVYKMGQIVPDGELGVQKRYQPVGDTLTDRFTSLEDNESKDTVRLYESGVAQACSPAISSKMVRESSGMFSGGRNDFMDDYHTWNDLPCSSDMVDDDDVIRSSVSDLSLSVGCMVDTDSVSYGSTTGDAAKYAWLNRGEYSENIRETNSASLLLPPEVVSQENVNNWDLSGIRKQRRSNVPEGRIIDLGSESSDGRAQQTSLQQSSACHRGYVTVDWRINNNNTNAENLIDSSQADTNRSPNPSGFWEETQSSQADTNRSPNPSGFWEETQSSQTVSGKTENKYKDISNIADPSDALHVKQRVAGVTQQLENQLVISFDSCDTFEKSYLCVYCGERTERCLYGVVCANCVFRRYYNNSLSDDEKVINYCYRREDIDSRAGIPASIFDESIKHSDEKRRTNKGTQHVGHFCAATQGVGAGKIDDFIRDNRAGQQEVSKSSSKGSRTVDDQSCRGTERVDFNVLSVLESDNDKSSDSVLSEDSNKSDRAPRISEGCQIQPGIGSWNSLFSHLAAQGGVSIDKTDTLFSERPPCVPPDRLSSTRTSDEPSYFIKSASSPNNNLRTDENFPSVSSVIHTSSVSSIPSRHTTSYVQTMKENSSIRNTNSYTSDFNVVGDSSNRSRENSSLPASLFTNGCHVNPLDNLHAQLSFISGNSGSAGSGDSGYVGSHVYQDHAEATCSFKPGTVSGDRSVSYIPEDLQTYLNHAAGKDNLCSFSRSRVWNELSPKETHSFVVPKTREEYDNADTYITAETHRESRLLPRPYHQMPLFKYGQARVSSLWTVPEEPENVCEEAFQHSMSTLPVNAGTIRNTDRTTLAYSEPYTTENMTELTERNSADNTNNNRFNLKPMSTMSLEGNYREFDMTVNKKPHLSASSERALSSSMGTVNDSCDVKSGTLYSRQVEERGSIKCGDNELETCNRFLFGEDTYITTSCSANHLLDTVRQECGDSSGSDRGERNDLLSEGKLNKHSPDCEDVPKENFTGNQPVLDRLFQSLSQISKQDVDSVYYRKSLFREDATDSDAESQKCHSSSHETDLMCSTSFSSDLGSSTSSDSIRHIHFSSSGKAEFKDAATDDYDNPASPRTAMSDQTKPQTELTEIGKHSDISIKDFDKIVEELNSSLSHIQEIEEILLPQNQSATKCEDLYQAFTNEEAEKQQNHGCIVLEDDDAIKYRFKRFLKKSHSKRKKGLKILKFFSRLGCVSGMASPPTGSPVVSRKHPDKCQQFLKFETELLPEQTLREPTLVSSRLCDHTETHSMPLAGNSSSPSSSNQSLDSVPSKADSAYSSFSESTEASANSLGILSMSNSQVHVSSDHPVDCVNMDASITSCSSSVDFSSSSSDVGVIHVSAIDRENIRTNSALKLGALTSTDIMSEVFDELNTCEGEVDTALLYNMRYGHTPAKIDKTWG